MARFTLHGIWASGPTYKVALLLSLAGEAFDYVHVDLQGGAQKQPDYLALNRFGVVPTLVDNHTGESYAQSGAIMETVAELTGKFLGGHPIDRRHAREWVFWGWDGLARGIYRTRASKNGFLKLMEDVATHYADDAKRGLGALNAQLGGRRWLVSDGPTFADVDLYGVVSFAPQAGFDLGDYPNVDDWLRRIEALPGFGKPEQILPRESRKA